MKIITRVGKAVGVAERWKQQYFQRGEWKYNATKEQTYHGLVALGEHPRPDDVDRVIGNTSWTSCHCDECRENVDMVVQVGQEPDYDSCTALLCQDCVIKALKEFP